ncbi:hypothetical protein HBI56_187320 [Parastagonospora nodorum]|uniref:Peroxidase n=1 Tax=Phaeosphaeria nodorum (strain SN15 / ATCC MYA-4574 / FGSC 10173) TaxID=321614 RepID=A0A7U2IAR1_PHANO|nr:hypothetical protein HBH56_162190 [Parastagonospora nodorum]QRD06397.1 hypothetical protein JI435_117760 [Parastagonospora nodorum SN15]KAH3931815.1 hypothetical protein HBH54_087040 [Parastagonospora nodorum]KAH3947469.1 hypothetical protein HBH53_114270 [Parastagonospora nodorum]KAH3972779.1 hypothetical protein HBH51_101690 [Parastagonospora nodorum]
MLSRFPILLALIAPTSAFSLWPRQTSSCPAVWTDVAKELQSTFSTCGRAAHGAIRAPFHDCINNGCDGSLILTDECSRSENGGLSFICETLLDLTNKYKVSAADMIQFAAAYAISACPLGPNVKALVGRTDSSVAAPLNSMPSSKDSVDSILAAFSARGFSSDDVVALLGTHSVAIQVVTDPNNVGQPLDSTPAVCDTKYYVETQSGTAPSSLDSDLRMANDTQTAKTWTDFGNSQDLWAAKFVDAWNRFAVIGNDVDSLQDCSSLIPTDSAKKRWAMSMPMGARGYARYHS